MKLKRLSYILSLFFIFVVPLLIELRFVYQRISFENLAYFVFVIMLIGSVWDIWATRHGKGDRLWLWQFNHNDTLGINFFDLPIEEYFFYVVSSSYVVFTWESIKFSLETNNKLMYIVIPLVACWSLIFIVISYIFGNNANKH